MDLAKIAQIIQKLIRVGVCELSVGKCTRLEVIGEYLLFVAFCQRVVVNILVHGQVTIIFVVCLSVCLFVCLSVCLCGVFLSHL